MNLDGREAILRALQDVVLTLRNKGSQVKNNPSFQQQWASKSAAVKRAVDELSLADRRWVDEEYRRWFDQFQKI